VKTFAIPNNETDQGQGGGQAIEDGGALGALFSHVKSIEEIPVRLKLFEEVRRNRASAMQMFSNAGQDQAEKVEKDARPFVVGPVPRKSRRLPRVCVCSVLMADLLGTLEQYHDYNFGYNVFRECERVRRRASIVV
jgi:salicylate hydroxylase